MTEEQAPSSFKIKMDLAPEEPPYIEDLKAKRLDKLGQRITLASILIPCVIGTAMILGYMDLKDRVAGLQSVGIQQNQSISETLESRFSSLSAKQSALEEASAKNTVSLQTTLVGIKDQLQKHQKILDQTVAAKADRKEMDQIRIGLDKSISDLDAAIQGNVAAQRLEESKLAKIAAQIATLGNDLKSFQAQIKAMEGVVSDLSEKQIHRDQIADQIKTSEDKMLASMAQIQNRLDDAIKALEKKVDKIAASTAPGQKSVLPNVPGAGTILEENLRQ